MEALIIIHSAVVIVNQDIIYHKDSVLQFLFYIAIVTKEIIHQIILHAQDVKMAIILMEILPVLLCHQMLQLYVLMEPYPEAHLHVLNVQ